MRREIDADTLRRWLDEQRPVTVLDVRTDEDRGQWTIPGSVHVNAYEALRTGALGPLADATFPPGRPVVTVCNMGRVSQAAAEKLANRGIDALSLTGGMKAWSLAWNTADVSLEDRKIRLTQVRRTGKGCLSYVLESDGEAVVIDASLPAEVYLDLAARHGSHIRQVVETHIHADHLSRARQLATRTAATLLVPEQSRAQFPFTPVAAGDRVTFGKSTLTALRTPGHTAESTSYVLDGEAVFTGDTLLVSGVGRPDLHADAEAARERARFLFHSLKQLAALEPDMLVLPAHTSESIAFDGKPVGARLREVNAWLAQWLASESAFVERVVAKLLPTPPNFVRIVELNEAGELPDGDPTDLEAGANRCAVS